MRASCEHNFAIGSICVFRTYARDLYEGININALDFQIVFPLVSFLKDTMKSYLIKIYARVRKKKKRQFIVF